MLPSTTEAWPVVRQRETRSSMIADDDDSMSVNPFVQ